MARQSNAVLLRNAADELAGEILDVIFDALKESGVTVGLKAKRAIFDKVESRLAEMDVATANNGNGKE